MSAFFFSGHAVDLVLVVIILEAGLLRFWRGFSLADIIALMLPGVFLLMALRAALTGAGWPWVCAWVTLSLPAHLFDLQRRSKKI